MRCTLCLSLLLPVVSLSSAWAQELLDPLEFLRGTVPKPGFVEAADMNGDGLMDIVTGSVELLSGETTPDGLMVFVAFGEPGGTFAPSASVAALSGPIRAMDIADMDGDGDIDIAVIASTGLLLGTGVAEVWLNSGVGSFTREAAESLPDSLLNDLEIIDVDGDGILDLFVSSGQGNSQAVFTGARWLRRDAMGQISGLRDLVTAGFAASRARLLDLDGDGDLDLMTANPSVDVTNELVWFENTAGFPIDVTTFQPLPFGSGTAVDFVAFDADSDGDLDLAALAWNFSATDSLRVLINDGGASFTLSNAYQSPRRGLDLLARDIDADGDLDLVCTALAGTFTMPTGEVTYMRNDGSGAFTGAVGLGAMPFQPRALDAADLDGDGQPEMLMAGGRAGTSQVDGLAAVEIYDNESIAGQIAFGSPRNILESLGEAPLQWADFNGDGLDDLCVQTIQGDVQFAGIKLALGNGQFGVATPVADVAPLTQLRQGGADGGDINGDGHADLVYLSPDVSVVSVSLGDGTGSFAPSAPLVSWFTDADFIELHDLDEDGDLDLLGTRVSATRLIFSLNDGAGAFTPPSSLGGGFGAPLQFLYVDLNGDGERDIVASSGVRLDWLRGQGGASFASRSQLAVWPEIPSDMVSGDFDGDGAVDVAAATNGASSGSPGRLYATFNEGGAFSPVSTVATAQFGWLALRALDVDLDGDDDLAASLVLGNAGLNSNLRVLESLGDRTFAAPASIESSGARIIHLSDRDVDADGDEDLIAGIGNVSALAVFTSRANRSLGATYCFGAVPNSTGSIGTIEAIGSSTPADNRVTLRSDLLPTSSFGFYLSSMMTDFVINVPGSEGTLCLGGDIGRYVGAGQVQNSGTTGAFELAIDLTAIPQPNGAVSVITGSTWNFQAWHRDAGSSGQATSNFTDAIQLLF